MIKIYKKLSAGCEVLSFFLVNEWQFGHGNVQTLWNKLEPEDQKLFAFDIENVEYSQMVAQAVLTGRLLLVKEDESTIQAALKRQTK